MSNKNFFIFTRGRTGSTAIIDELGKHPEITTMQELFIRLEKAPRLAEAYKKYGKEFYKHVPGHLILPFDAWSRQYVDFKIPWLGSIYLYHGRLVSQKVLIDHYLEKVEQVGRDVKPGARVGFKVLANHFIELPTLCEVLKQRAYQAIYLERENHVRQVLSGIIAQKRGIYNRKHYQPGEDSYVIDLDDFEMRIKAEQRSVRSEVARLSKEGFDVHVITYERFLNDREGFFKDICNELGVSDLLPEKTEYSVMIQNLPAIVENYDELVARVDALGLGYML